MKQPDRASTTRGFSRASGLMQARIRKASEGRGFAQSRVLTHWAEIVGSETADATQPVNITYGRGGMGATLTVLTTGAMAPMIEMQKEKIRERVNACYGYNAITKLRITQTAPTGFAEGRVAFKPAPRKAAEPDPALKETAKDLAEGCGSDELRAALEALATNVLTKQKSHN